MLSLYIHVPFCDKKCGYCSFFVVPKEGIDPQEKMIEGYMEGLLRDIKAWGEHYKKPEIRTLYFGGGTPGILGKRRLIQIIDAVGEHFDISYLEELSIELNPNPYDEIIDLVDSLNKRYADFHRIRFSFGIQSFDDSVLHASGRQYSFVGIQKFLRDLRQVKDSRNVFNLDFIAFGKGVRTKDDEYLFWDRERREWFETIAASQFIDSFSLYTLELFAGAAWEKTKRKEIDGISHLDLTHVPFETDHEKITSEYQWLKDVVIDANYRRYELSNFAYLGKESIHNMVYRNMDSYIGLGPSASSFLTGKYADDLPAFLGLEKVTDSYGVRFTESSSIFGYTKQSTIDPKSVILLTEREYKIEQLFLNLRMSRGVKNISNFAEVLVPHWEKLAAQYLESGFVTYENDIFSLTDEGLDVYNTLVSDLLEL